MSDGLHELEAYRWCRDNATSIHFDRTEVHRPVTVYGPTPSGFRIIGRGDTPIEAVLAARAFLERMKAG